MKSKLEQDRTALKNVLRFIVGELEKRISNVKIGPSEENKRLLEADYESYQSMRKMAIELNVEVQEYDNKLAMMLKK